jgi:hypothetical protein
VTFTVEPRCYVCNDEDNGPWSRDTETGTMLCESCHDGVKEFRSWYRATSSPHETSIARRDREFRFLHVSRWDMTRSIDKRALAAERKRATRQRHQSSADEFRARLLEHARGAKK